MVAMNLPGVNLLNVPGRPVPSNRGMRLGPAGLFSTFALGAGFTWQTKIALAQDFDAIQLVYAVSSNVGNEADVTIQATLQAISNLGNSPVALPGTPLAATFAAATSLVASAPAAATAPSSTKRKKFLASDIMPISSLPRDDGGNLPPLIMIRSYATGGNCTIMGASTGIHASLASYWATHASGRVWENRIFGGNGLSRGLASFNSDALSPRCPLVGVIYYARGQVVNVIGVGDSITEGPISTEPCEGFIFGPCAELSNKDGIAVEYSNLAWNGATYSEIVSLLTDAFAADLPADIVVMPTWTPNGTAVPLTEADQRFQRQMAMRLIGLAKTKNAQPIVWTGLPTNTAVKAWNASDSFRRDHATAMRLLVNKGIPVVDLEAIAAGVDNGGGQIQIKAGKSDDNIHQNTSLNTDLKPPIKAAIAAHLPVSVSQLYS